MRALQFSEAEKSASPLRFVDRNDPVLWAPASPVTDITAQVIPNIAPMRHLMTVGVVKAIGLSAPQVGIPLRFFITKFDHLHCVINPEIVEVSPGRTSKPEGCMSWNHGKTRTWVSRHDWVILRYLDRHGVEKTHRITELEARCVQHEFDHLQGKNIFART